MLRGSVELSHQTRSAATGSRNLGNNVKEVWKGLGAAASLGEENSTTEEDPSDEDPQDW